MPTTICFTSIFPPFSRGGIVLKHSALFEPSGPQTLDGSAPVGSGGNAIPPASPSAVSLFNHFATSGAPGKTPTEPINPLKGIFTPGTSAEIASSLFNCQLAMNGSVNISLRKPNPGTIVV